MAFGWASRITTVAIGMIVPGLVGFWLDHRLGTLILFTLIGFGLGVTTGAWQLVRMASSKNYDKQKKEDGSGVR